MNPARRPAARRRAARRYFACAALIAAGACGRDDFGGDAIGPGAGTARRPELAPIESVELVVRESFPPQYAVRVTSGLPSGCAAFDRIDVVRAGDTVDVAVWNTLPADPQVACTMIYGTTVNMAELGADFVSGRRYEVRVNGRPAAAFTAR